MLCILFDYCDKGDLDTYIKNQNGFKLTEGRIKRFIIEILLAIDYLHTQNIIHRDLKPSNIFLKGKEYTV
jgi:NIMA (never in mitosis gene a)-related kinase